MATSNPKSGKNALTDEELIAAIEAEEKTAYGFYLGELAEERQEALDRYYAKPFPEDEDIPDGRSRVVSSDVSDTIEWVLPSLLKIFLSGDKVCTIDPQGPEDIEAAEQETEVTNHLVLQRNNAFETFYCWFKDALLQKVGYVAVYYDETTDTSEETYYGKTDDEFAMLAADPDVEIVAHSETSEDVRQMVPQQDGSLQPSVVKERRHDVTVRKVEKARGLRIEPVPPEEMFVSTSHRRISLQDARFVEHKTRKTLSDIRSMGFDVADDISDETGDKTEERNRDQYAEWREDNRGGNPATREVWLRDIYIQVDRNGDGIAERLRVLMVGRNILHEEVAEVVPFAAICPIPAPHRHVGQSYADILLDLQEIKSMLWRLTLDNGYLSLNGRHAISDRVNLDDMLVSRPGGVVRVEGGDIGGAIMPLQHVPTGNNGLQLLEYTDSVKENRSGVTKYNQGLDANSLNKTATGITAIMGAAQERIGLVARIFAETGVRDAMLLAHHCIRKYDSKGLAFQLRNQWITVDPRSWKKRTDMSIAVGLGTGTRDQQLAHLSTMYQMSMPAIQAGVLPPVTLVEILRKMSINAGFKDVDRLFPDPQQQQPQQQGPDPAAMQAQQQAQMEQQKAAAEFELKKAGLAMDQQKAQAQMEVERMKLEFQAQQQAMQAQYQAAADMQKLEFERWKVEQEQQTKLIIADMQNRGAMDVATEGYRQKVGGDVQTMVAPIAEQVAAITAQLQSPIVVQRGPDGRIAAVNGRPVVRH